MQLERNGPEGQCRPMGDYFLRNLEVNVRRRERALLYPFPLSSILAFLFLRSGGATKRDDLANG